jgi:hypothetical protein
LSCREPIQDNSISAISVIIRNSEMSSFNTGTKVEWNWGEGKGTGVIKECFEDDVTKTIKGSEITRKASSSDPAYLIEQEDGDKVLKGHSEVSKAE